MKKYVSFLLLMISMMSNGQKFVEAEHYKTSNFDVAIFPDNYFDLIGNKRFTPLKQDVLLAESVLKTRLKQLNKDLINQFDKPIIHKKLHKYKRQYFGCFDENGRKYLLINCFWFNKGNHENWLKQRIDVLDGGSYYWNVRYYFDTDKLEKLEVNGVG
ncbi:hypothetical protein J2X31_001747 [Flavobacterium arsenatis]|uniref:Uncharacterized protein n=1 Tax=Flavobacterium arsenatis TaxID=1484332 RepID=A0ABU1TP30_9FLAO|nr:hypothetical protein [Flavobacterium arsenatis]MDR6967735.1 hypothetical protein [Flavobacterium arsenatis]